MTNKQSVYEALKKLTMNTEKGKEKSITANKIASILNIRRNVVSHYLNELCAEGKAVKFNSRPVYFFDKETYEKNKGSIEPAAEVEETDAFSKLIGYMGSLKSQVEQCKVSASYPPNGLPILLVGKSGVGKSYIAGLIYEYALQNEHISNDAPYIVFNCAEYADNPELLSAVLFGYQKGTFTGAVSDKVGLIEEADGGYLFLDEVHRLSPEGQERLFLFLDKGVFRRFGETGNWRKSNVRFIFATTEEPEKFMLETFLRRIPLVVRIPSFLERPISEKIQLIYHFYKKEALSLDKDLNISRQVMDLLLSINVTGNIGKLINIIKYSCAHAYNSSEKDTSLFNISISNLPKSILLDINELKNKYNLKDMVIHRNADNLYVNGLPLIDNDSEINKIIISLSNNAINFDSRKIDLLQFGKTSVLYINKLSDELIFNKEKYRIDTISLNIMTKLIDNIMKIMENAYGIKFYGNSINVLSYILSYFWQNISNISKEEEKIIHKGKSIMEKNFPKSFIIANRILSIIQENIDYKFDSRVIVYLMFYIYNILDEKTNRICSIIIAHGYSTASSIASVANKLFGEYLFEAFDMPIEVSVKQVMHQVNDYLKNIDTSHGVIMLVDMGSLEDMYKSLTNIEGDIGIVNNITTQLALDVGNKMILGQSIEQIVESSVKNNSIRYKFIKSSKKKKKAIITTCISGIGTAVKIRDLLKKCISCDEIEIIACDYNKLKNNGLAETIFNDYQALIIIGTADPNIEGVPYVYLEDLIEGKGEQVLNKVLQNFIDSSSLDKMNRDIVKLFSLQNVLNQLTILNPNKIIDQVERIISDLELGIGIKFENDLKISLYIHISCLIERLILKEGIVSYQNIEEFEKCHSSFIKLIKKSFSVILETYKIEIQTDEIVIIYQIIKNKIGKLDI